MVSYEPLWETMKARGVTTYTLIEKHRIPSKTIYNLKHNKNITTATIENFYFLYPSHRRRRRIGENESGGSLHRFNYNL